MAVRDNAIFLTCHAIGSVRMTPGFADDTRVLFPYIYKSLMIPILNFTSHITFLELPSCVTYIDTDCFFMNFLGLREASMKRHRTMFMKKTVIVELDEVTSGLPVQRPGACP